MVLNEYLQWIKIRIYFLIKHIRNEKVQKCIENDFTKNVAQEI